MEFPTNPTKRQLERQQAIASVISGLAYKLPDVAINPDFDMDEYNNPQLPSTEPGFNWETFQTYLK